MKQITVLRFIARMRKYCLLLAVCAAPAMACAADASVSHTASIDVNVWVENEYRNNKATYGADPEMLVERGLLANRKHRYVDLLATATGADADTALDAFIITGGSRPDTALSVTSVKPAAIQAALEFIGMNAGYPLDDSKRHHWPKGERVTITYYWDDLDTGFFDQSVMAEKLMTDVTMNSQIPALGFRFVGAPSPGGISIATAYNSMGTVLEVPYIVSQRFIQGRLFASETYRFSRGQKLRIRFRPEFRGDDRRVHDFVMNIQAGARLNAEKLQNLNVSLSTPQGDIAVNGGFESTFVFLKALVDDGKEPFLQLNFSDSLTVAGVRTIARFVQTFLIAQDIRIEPSEAHLYYSAFLPHELWREPSKRGGSAPSVEIHLAGHTAELSGEIIQRPQRSVTPTAMLKKIRFNNEMEFKDAIQQGGPWKTEGVLFFVSPESSYGKIRHIHELIQSFFQSIYVFM